MDIPKVELHMHAETRVRLDKLIAQRTDRQPIDWRGWLQEVAELPPGMPRLAAINGDFFRDDESRYDAESAAWLTDALESAAQVGAKLVEIRFRSSTALRTGFMAVFREVEERVRARYATFRAEAIISGIWPTRPGAAEVIEACLRAREEGLAGIDFIPMPHDSEADWTEAYHWADRASEVGLGITAHLGEFSSANVTAALRTPGLSRIGHGAYAAYEPDLLEQIADAGVTVECCLTSNVVLGAVSSLEEHTIKRFVEAGLPVTLNTDNPVRMCTSIGRGYEQAASLGFGVGELLSFTRRGIAASFTSEDRKTELLGILQRY